MSNERDNKDDRTDEQRKLDAIRENFQDAQDGFNALAEITRYVALRFQLAADPGFMARPTPVKLFSNN